MHQGLEKHGVGRWREISEDLLPKWDDQAIRVKASRLLGSQSLARYLGWKGDRCGLSRGCCSLTQLRPGADCAAAAAGRRTGLLLHRGCQLRTSSSWS